MHSKNGNLSSVPFERKKVEALVFTLTPEQIQIKEIISLLSPKILFFIKSQQNNIFQSEKNQNYLSEQDWKYISDYPININQFIKDNKFILGGEREIGSFTQQMQTKFDSLDRIIESELENLGLGMKNIATGKSSAKEQEKRKTETRRILEELETKFMKENSHRFDSHTLISDLGDPKYIKNGVPGNIVTYQDSVGKILEKPEENEILLIKNFLSLLDYPRLEIIAKQLLKGYISFDEELMIEISKINISLFLESFGHNDNFSILLSQRLKELEESHLTQSAITPSEDNIIQNLGNIFLKNK